MSSFGNNSFGKPLGQTALHSQLALTCPPPSAVQSFAVPAARKSVVDGDCTKEFYPLIYHSSDSIITHLKFAFRHEPLDLRIINAALESMGSAALASWVREEPTGAFARQAWFFYELMTGETLDLEPVKTGNYVEAISPKRHFTSTPVKK